MLFDLLSQRPRRQVQNVVVGSFFGLLLVLGAIALLWMNEGRVDLSRVAAQSVAVNATRVEPSAEGKLVAVSGVLSTQQALGDPLFLNPGSYIHLERKVEMFAWEESRSGGSDTATPTVSYKTEWSERPDDSSTFQISEGHKNPPMSLPSESFTVPSAEVGAYQIMPQQMTLPATQPVRLAAPMLLATHPATFEGDYLFIGQGNLLNPEVGDLRIHFEAVPSNLSVTVLGKQEGSRVVPYFHRSGTELYRLFTEEREGAIRRLADEHRAIGWGLRIMGFIMMWVGMLLIVGPLRALLGFIPVAGNIGRAILGALTFVLAMLLTIVTSVLSFIAHNPLVLIVVLALLLGIGYLVYRQQERAPRETPVPE